MEIFSLNKIFAVPYGFVFGSDALDLMRKCPVCSVTIPLHEYAGEANVHLVAVHHLRPVDQNDATLGFLVTTLDVASGEVKLVKYVDSEYCPLPARVGHIANLAPIVLYELAHKDSDGTYHANWFVSQYNNAWEVQFEAYVPPLFANVLQLRGDQNA